MPTASDVLKKAYRLIFITFTVFKKDIFQIAILQPPRGYGIRICLATVGDFAAQIRLFN